MDPGASDIAWGTMVMGLLGGLALFLHGMDLMSMALKELAGSRLREVLARLTANRFLAVATGCGVTAVIQSSSVTTVLAIGFVSAGLMGLPQAIAVTMGADIGTTITAQVIAFKVTHYALGLVALGFVLALFRSRPVVARYGAMLLGLGVVFFGMSLMSEHMRPLRSHQPFLDLMQSMQSPMWGVLLGAGFTALVQSSSATLGVIIALASQGLVPLEAGVALILGANIGTTVTALLAAIGKPRAALRVALAHVVVKCVTVLVWLPLVTPLADLGRWLSPAADSLTGLDRLAAETPRQLANVHTLVNVVGVSLQLGFVGLIAALVTRLTGPDREADPADDRAPYLDRALLADPAIALGSAAQALTELGARVEAQFGHSLAVVLDGDESADRALARHDRAVDGRYQQLVAFLRELARRSLPGEQATATLHLVALADQLESIGDVVDKNLRPLAASRRRDEVSVSPESAARLADLHASVRGILADAVAGIGGDQGRARAAVASKGSIRSRIRDLDRHHAQRLLSDAPNRVATYAIEADTVEYLRRVASLARRLAKMALRD